MDKFNKLDILNMTRFEGEEGLISLLTFTNSLSFQPVIDGMDQQVLLIMERVTPGKELEHWVQSNIRVCVQRITPSQLEKWLISSDNHDVVQGLVRGDVVIDRNGYLQKLRDQFIEWPPLLRLQKMLSEFSHFARSYMKAKQDIKEGHVLDAYANVLASLHYWAHIAIVEAGMHPELTVWDQIKRVNLGIYKLYEELTTSTETVEQRVQLVLLACEFSVLTKMESSCALLMNIVSSREQPWSPSELMQHKDLIGLSIDISLLLQKLVKRGCIHEVALAAMGKQTELVELRYTISS
ncbi:MAG: nucleotidyltransferase-like protein [Candidatus Cohnella colombiensis]|uniref:Nucleotidyltransferase-like protein n=1 Tax=Candidatus Cohnella colombiensis TaxID=3121368 RepID=A0AA95EYD0_9BACL|nr:MAG: nucleotidyltransferase-like protein [Cohnella sp.]